MLERIKNGWIIDGNEKSYVRCSMILILIRIITISKRMMTITGNVGARIMNGWMERFKLWRSCNSACIAGANRTREMMMKYIMMQCLSVTKKHHLLKRSVCVLVWDVENIPKCICLNCILATRFRPLFALLILMIMIMMMRTAAMLLAIVMTIISKPIVCPFLRLLFSPWPPQCVNLKAHFSWLISGQMLAVALWWEQGNFGIMKTVTLK